MAQACRRCCRRLFIVGAGCCLKKYRTKYDRDGTGNIGLIQNLGKILFKDYVVPFEISSVLFLSAMVGAVILGKREKLPPLPEVEVRGSH